jgi:hypothetical protein
MCGHDGMYDYECDGMCGHDDNDVYAHRLLFYQLLLLLLLV